jgi:predicted TIM-barrel fold metal-dependent hydrolase
MVPRRNPLAGVKVIDVDTHLSEPADLWTSRAPAHLRDGLPRQITVDGRRKWTMGDSIISAFGANSVVAKDGSLATDMSFGSWTLDDIHPGCSYTKARLEMMDEQGVWAHIIYPNVLGFGGQRAMRIDASHRLAATQIYNDALAEMQEESGQRLYGMILLPWWDIELAVAEVERCAAMGMRGVNINSAPHAHGLPDLAEAYWNPLWEVCAKHDLPINSHIGGSEEADVWLGNSGWPSLPSGKKLTVGGVMMLLDQVKIMTNFIMSGVFDRFPTLKVVAVESGIGWIPFMLKHIEYIRSDVPGIGDYSLSLTPKEYFLRNMGACFWFENDRLESLLTEIGEDNVMYETDFPHPTCLYPNGIERICTALEGADPGLLKKVTSTNASRFYNIPV